MPRRSRDGNEESPEPPCGSSAGIIPRHALLDSDERSCAQRHARLVQTAGTSALANRQLLEIPRRGGASGSRGYFAASLRIIASRTPPSARLNSTHFAAAL